jgi:two-component system nitrate/nitrite sensor histidine kinase NarX
MHTDDALLRFMDHFEALMPGCKLGLSLPGEDFGPARRGLFTACEQVPDCPWRDGRLSERPQVCGACLRRGQCRVVCAVANSPSLAMGVLSFDSPYPASGDLRQLLEDSARIVGISVQLLRYKREQQRKEATSQHGVLARELHDSVAQQLGYLSFQTSLIQGRLDQPEHLTPLVAELRGGLSQLQRQVRELITSARLTMDGRSLRQALADSVAEFSRRCIIVFELDNRLADDALSPPVELQLLQIIREALANVVRHSHARHVRLELRQTQEGELSVSVEDDGIGLGPASLEDNHYGLAIIRERAASIGAHLSIETIRPHGTRVQLNLNLPSTEQPQRRFDAQYELIADR